MSFDLLCKNMGCKKSPFLLLEKRVSFACYFVYHVAPPCNARGKRVKKSMKLWCYKK